MKHIFSGAMLAALLLGALQVDASCSTYPPSQKQKSINFWTCIIHDEKVASVNVRLDNVTSVAMHSYLIGSQMIREVTIDTTGNNSIRLYCLTVHEATARYADRVKNTRDLVDRKTGGATRFPSKKFPEGTYSHNIEFQIDSVKDLEEIYESVMRAVFTNKGEVIEVK